MEATTFFFFFKPKSRRWNSTTKRKAVEGGQRGIHAADQARCADPSQGSQCTCSGDRQGGGTSLVCLTSFSHHCMKSPPTNTMHFRGRTAPELTPGLTNGHFVIAATTYPSWVCGSRGRGTPGVRGVGPPCTHLALTSFLGHADRWFSNEYKITSGDIFDHYN